MKLEENAYRRLRELGKALPDNTNIEICLRGNGGFRECHKFRVVAGVVHHSESHSDDFIRSGAGPLSEDGGSLKRED